MSEFKFDEGLVQPAVTRTGVQSERAQKFAAMKTGQSFLEEVTVSPKLKGTERDKSFNEQCRVLSNRISGAIGRFKKKNPGVVLSAQKVDDDVLGHGVRIWCNDDGKAPAKKPAKA